MLHQSVDSEILRAPLTFSNNDKLTSFLISGVHDASSLRIMECFDIRKGLRANVVFSVATTVFQRVGERTRISVDRVGTCHHADQGCCSTIAQVFSVTWWIGLSFSVLSIVVDLEVRYDKSGPTLGHTTLRSWSLRNSNDGIRSDAFLERSIIVNLFSEPLRRCLFSVAAHRH